MDGDHNEPTSTTHTEPSITLSAATSQPCPQELSFADELRALEENQELLPDPGARKYDLEHPDSELSRSPSELKLPSTPRSTTTFDIPLTSSPAEVDPVERRSSVEQAVLSAVHLITEVTLGQDIPSSIEDQEKEEDPQQSLEESSEVPVRYDQPADVQEVVRRLSLVDGAQIDRKQSTTECKTDDTDLGSNNKLGSHQESMTEDLDLRNGVCGADSHLLEAAKQFEPTVTHHKEDAKPPPRNNDSIELSENVALLEAAQQELKHVEEAEKMLESLEQKTKSNIEHLTQQTGEIREEIKSISEDPTMSTISAAATTELHKAEAGIAVLQSIETELEEKVSELEHKAADVKEEIKEIQKDMESAINAVKCVESEDDVAPQQSSKTGEIPDKSLISHCVDHRASTASERDVEKCESCDEEHHAERKLSHPETMSQKSELEISEHADEAQTNICDRKNSVDRNTERKPSSSDNPDNIITETTSDESDKHHDGMIAQEHAASDNHALPVVAPLDVELTAEKKTDNEFVVSDAMQKIERASDDALTSSFCGTKEELFSTSSSNVVDNHNQPSSFANITSQETVSSESSNGLKTKQTIGNAKDDTLRGVEISHEIAVVKPETKKDISETTQCESSTSHSDSSKDSIFKMCTAVATDKVEHVIDDFSGKLQEETLKLDSQLSSISQNAAELENIETKKDVSETSHCESSTSHSDSSKDSIFKMCTAVVTDKTEHVIDDFSGKLQEETLKLDSQLSSISQNAAELANTVIKDVEKTAETAAEKAEDEFSKLKTEFSNAKEQAEEKLHKLKNELSSVTDQIVNNLTEAVNSFESSVLDLTAKEDKTNDEIKNKPNTDTFSKTTEEPENGLETNTKTDMPGSNDHKTETKDDISKSKTHSSESEEPQIAKALNKQMNNDDIKTLEETSINAKPSCANEIAAEKNTDSSSSENKCESFETIHKTHDTSINKNEPNLEKITPENKTQLSANDLKQSLSETHDTKNNATSEIIEESKQDNKQPAENLTETTTNNIEKQSEEQIETKVVNKESSQTENEAENTTEVPDVKHLDENTLEMQHKLMEPREKTVETDLLEEKTSSDSTPDDHQKSVEMVESKPLEDVAALSETPDRSSENVELNKTSIGVTNTPEVQITTSESFNTTVVKKPHKSDITEMKDEDEIPAAQEDTINEEDEEKKDSEKNSLVEDFAESSSLTRPLQTPTSIKTFEESTEQEAQNENLEKTSTFENQTFDLSETNQEVLTAKNLTTAETMSGDKKLVETVVQIAKEEEKSIEKTVNYDNEHSSQQQETLNSDMQKNVEIESQENVRELSKNDVTNSAESNIRGTEGSNTKNAECKQTVDVESCKTTDINEISEKNQEINIEANKKDDDTEEISETHNDTKCATEKQIETTENETAKPVEENVQKVEIKKTQATKVPASPKKSPKKVQKCVSSEPSTSPKKTPASPKKSLLKTTTPASPKRIANNKLHDSPKKDNKQEKPEKAEEDATTTEKQQNELNERKSETIHKPRSPLKLRNIKPRVDSGRVRRVGSKTPDAQTPDEGTEKSFTRRPGSPTKRQKRATADTRPSRSANEAPELRTSKRAANYVRLRPKSAAPHVQREEMDARRGNATVTTANGAMKKSPSAENTAQPRKNFIMENKVRLQLTQMGQSKPEGSYLESPKTDNPAGSVPKSTSVGSGLSSATKKKRNKSPPKEPSRPPWTNFFTR